VKRRTTPHPSGAITDLHRKAFEHAMRVLKPDKSLNRYVPKHIKDNRGRIVRWSADLTTEQNHQGTLRADFSCTRGFRFAIDATHGTDLWQSHCAGIAEKKRFLPHRLAAYRERLCFWQRTSARPLTFRDFNRLLAALSYDFDTHLEHQARSARCLPTP